MELDRKLQHAILKSLKDMYPDSLLVSALPGYSYDRYFMGNLFYLQEHGLIEGGDIREPGQCRSMVDAQITKLGLDFITDDGGLAAILGGLTITFNTIELLEQIGKALRQGGAAEEKIEEIRDVFGATEPEALKKMIAEIICAYVVEKGSPFWDQSVKR